MIAAFQAESASSILVTRSSRNPQVDGPGVLYCLDRWAGRAPPDHVVEPGRHVPLPLIIRVLIDQRGLLGGLPGYGPLGQFLDAVEVGGAARADVELAAEAEGVGPTINGESTR
jgi:hypothetical protein